MLAPSQLLARTSEPQSTWPGRRISQLSGDQARDEREGLFASERYVLRILRKTGGRDRGRGDGGRFERAPGSGPAVMGLHFLLVIFELERMDAGEHVISS